MFCCAGWVAWMEWSWLVLLRCGAGGGWRRWERRSCWRSEVDLLLLEGRWSEWVVWWGLMIVWRDQRGCFVYLWGSVDACRGLVACSEWSLCRTDQRMFWGLCGFVVHQFHRGLRTGHSAGTSVQMAHSSCSRLTSRTPWHHCRTHPCYIQNQKASFAYHTMELAPSNASWCLNVIHCRSQDWSSHQDLPRRTHWYSCISACSPSWPSLLTLSPASASSIDPNSPASPSRDQVSCSSWWTHLFYSMSQMRILGSLVVASLMLQMPLLLRLAQSFWWFDQKGLSWLCLRLLVVCWASSQEGWASPALATGQNYSPFGSSCSYLSSQYQ